VSRQSIVIALVLVALSRLIWIGRLPLLPDEAYYWDWSRRLDLGYFDHPPGVALVVRATTAIGGVSPAAVRLGMVLLGLGTAALAYRLAGRLGGRLAGWLAFAAAVICPLYALLSLYAAPDGPMLFLWAATVYATARAATTGRGRYWYAAGLALGLALLSKYVAILLAPSIFLFVALFQRWWLRRREPYLATLVALLVFSPNLWWNLRHGWVSFRFQLGHGACQGAGSLADRLAATALYAATQVGVVGPLLALALGAGTVAAVVIGAKDRRHPRLPSHTLERRAPTSGPRLGSEGEGLTRHGTGGVGAGAALLLLACCTVVPSLFFLAVHGLAHWAAPAYFSAIVCAAVVAARWWRRVARRGRLVLLALGMVTGLATAAESGYLLYAVAGGAPLPGPLGAAIGPTLVDPAAGWRATARAAGAALHGLDRGQRRPAVLLADSYGTAAELAFNLPGHPRVYSSSNQYSLWGLPPAPPAGQGALILVSNAGTLASSGSTLRQGARLAATVSTRAQGRLVRRLEIAVLRPPARATRAALADLMSYAWGAAATGCEGSRR